MINRFRIVYFQRKRLPVKQLQPLPQVGKPYSSLRSVMPWRLGMHAVQAFKGYIMFILTQTYFHERRMPIAYAMLESVFDDADKEQRRDEDAVKRLLRQIHSDAHFGAGSSLAHQLHIVAYKFLLLLKRGIGLGPFIKHISHQPRQLHNHVLCHLGVNIHHAVDVVEHVHEKVGIELCFEMLQFLFLVRSICAPPPFLLLLRTRKKNDGNIKAQHQYGNDKIDGEQSRYTEKIKAVSSRLRRTGAGLFKSLLRLGMLFSFAMYKRLMFRMLPDARWHRMFL